MGELYDVGDRVSFKFFCETCERIKSSKGQLKSELLSTFFSDCKNIDPNHTRVDLYSVLRLLLPQAERERGSYGIKETSFARLYVRILNLPKEGNDAVKLMNYKAPSASASAVADFAEIAFWVLKSRCRPNVKNYTLNEINGFLDGIATFNSENKPRSIDDELTRITTTMSVLEQKWLIRIILKDLKLGMGQVKILTTFHNDAPDLFDSTSSLQKVCSTLYSPSIHLHEIEIEMFAPFRPMLLERLDIVKINALMKRDDVYVMEKKFDGERFQIHMKEGTFKYFSRNGYDFTDTYGDTYSSNGMLTPHLNDSIQSSVDSFIVDGEMMGWHKRKKAFSSKGINFDVKKITEDSVYRPCFCAFDILLYNGIVLTNKPFKERILYLDSLFSDKEGVILHSERVEVKEGEVILEALNKAIEDQEEGIVVKNVMSLYKPNSRKAGCFKIKPEYTEGVMNELDFLIVGGYYADNKRYGMVGSVLLGVVDTTSNKDGVPTVFHACGKVKLTLIREDFEELCIKLQPHWNVVSKETNLTTILWTKDKPDVWIEPQNSFIVQVKASELVRSNQFKTDFTLRFPRVEKIRYDKPWYDCITLDEYEKLTQHSHGVEKLTSRKIHGDDLVNGDTSPKKRNIFKLADHFQPVSSLNIEEKSELLAGKEICVITGNETFTKKQLESKVLENGGKTVQNPGKNTFCVIAGNVNARVTNVINSKEFNVANVNWFLRTLESKNVVSGTIPEWTPMDLLGTSKETAEKFAIEYDEFGINYTGDVTVESFKYSIQRAREIGRPIYLTDAEMTELDHLFFNGPSPVSFLRNHYVHFFDDGISSKEHFYETDLKLLKIYVKLYGGKITEELNEDTTHVVLHSFDKTVIRNIVRILNCFETPPELVSVEWINKCIEKKCFISSDEFIIDTNKF